jgi:hypothetical protein
MAEVVPLIYNPSGGWNKTLDVTADSITLAGLTMNGDIDANSNKVVSQAAGSTAGNSVVYGQAGASLAGLAIITNPITMGGQKITGAAPGANTGEVVTWEQLTSVASGLDFKESLRLGTDAALPANTRTGNVLTADANGALPNIDGTAPALDDRILVKNEATGANNGLYYVSQLGDGSNPWTLTRTTDADTNPEVTSGLVAAIEEGTANGNKLFILVTDDPITLNTTPLLFTIYQTLSDVIAGTGLTKSGNTINAIGGDGIVANADDLEVDLVVTNPGLEFSGGKLQVKAGGANGIVRGATGVEVEIDATPNTLKVDADGLGVVGLPSLFEINDAAVGATVTAANLNTLTNTSNADALHGHTGLTVDKAKRVENAMPVHEPITAGDPVYFELTTANRVGKARADAEAKAKVIGVAASTQGTPGANTEVVSDGVLTGVLSSATKGVEQWLGSTGGLTETQPATSGDRLIICGYAKNASDLFVKLDDFGEVP